VQPFLDAWAKSEGAKGGGRIDQYAPGSTGPECADELMARDGRQWHVVGR